MLSLVSETQSHGFTVRSKDFTAAISLATAVLGMTAGACLHWAALGRVGDMVWVAVAALGIGISIWSMIRSLLNGRLGVDVIALLALGGAVTIREYLAAAIISVMLATGQTLDSWASGRAQRELEALLARAPKTAHRYRENSLETERVFAVAVGSFRCPCEQGLQFTLGSTRRPTVKCLASGEHDADDCRREVFANGHRTAECQERDNVHPKTTVKQTPDH